MQVASILLKQPENDLLEPSGKAWIIMAGEMEGSSSWTANQQGYLWCNRVHSEAVTGEDYELVWM